MCTPVACSSLFDDAPKPNKPAAASSLFDDAPAPAPTPATPPKKEAPASAGSDLFGGASSLFGADDSAAAKPAAAAPKPAAKAASSLLFGDECAATSSCGDP
jgi:hypothetical protein